MKPSVLKRPTGRRLVWVACGACGVWLAGCGAPASGTVDSESRPVLSVELVTPSRETWPERLSASGEVAAWQEAVIGTEVTGIRLQEVLADVGDVVARGQLLARFEENSLRAELARLDAAVAEAEANLAQARSDAARADQLQATHAISAQAAQGYITQATVAQARLDSVRAQREAQRLMLAHARVTAPDDGVVTSRSATLGAVGMLGTELFRLQRQGRLEWRAEVPADALPRLSAGTPVELRRPDGAIVRGTLRQRAPSVDARTRNGIAYVDLPIDGGLVAGMYLTGSFVLHAREALAVPESAVVQRDGYHYLMRVDAGLRVQSLKVTTGRRQDGAIEVLEGADAEDRIVKSGGAFLSDGDLVDVAADGL